MLLVFPSFQHVSMSFCSRSHGFCTEFSALLVIGSEFSLLCLFHHFFFFLKIFAFTAFSAEFCKAFFTQVLRHFEHITPFPFLSPLHFCESLSVF